MNFIYPARSVAAHTFSETLRNRFAGFFLAFGGALIYSSLVVGAMAVDQEGRVLLDFGLALMELLALAFALFTSATAVSREVETKTIYLIFSRPVSRPAYLLGRLAGLHLSSLGVVAGLAVMHSSLLFFKGSFPGLLYVQALAFLWLKTTVIASAVFFVSLFASGTVSAVSIGLILWLLGHFMAEARFLLEKAPGFAAKTALAVLWAVPNLQLFSFREFMDGPGAPAGAAAALAYAMAWWAASYSASWLLFRKKEF